MATIGLGLLLAGVLGGVGVGGLAKLTGQRFWPWSLVGALGSIVAVLILVVAAMRSLSH